jgi:hypothetical protein
LAFLLTMTDLTLSEGRFLEHDFGSEFRPGALSGVIIVSET